MPASPRDTHRIELPPRPLVAAAQRPARQRPRRISRLATGLAVAASALVIPAGAQAAVTTFGSNLSGPASLNTVDNVLPNPHAGADMALWNTAIAGASAAAPASGQIVSVNVKGCAESVAGAPTTSTEIHFQDLVPGAGGSFSVNVTTQPFDLPICGAGVDGNTITTFQPTNFCVKQGDFVSFNDNGGFDPNFYPNGVRYMVLGSRTGSRTDSFIRHNGTNNGATFSPGDTTSFDGFATNPNEELLLQAKLATGPDASPNCIGGTSGSAAPGVIQTAPPSAVTSSGATFTAVVNPHGAPTTAHFAYAVDLGFGLIAQATFSTYTHATPEVNVGSDFTDHTISATVPLLPNATYHWAVVVTNVHGTVTGPDQSFKTPADPPPPPPVLGKTVDVGSVTGVVLVKLPKGFKLTNGTIARVPKVVKGQGFVPLTEARSIPVGSILDTTAGTASLNAATGTKAHPNFTGDFSAGVFELLQNRKQKGLTQLNIMDTVNRAKACASVGKKGTRASAAKVSSKVLGLLKSKVRGSFTTRGDYSGATVRGTEWSVTNTCAGTLTKVTRGAVLVDVFRTHKTILVGRGHSFLASAPRFTVGKR